MPHDAEHREMTNSEVAKSRKEVAEDLRIRPIKVISRAKNMDVIIHVHIPAMRNMLSLCWFDEHRCKHGIACLENYKADYDEEKKVLSNRPAHDWACHGADGYRTFAVGYEPIIEEKYISNFHRVRNAQAQDYDPLRRAG